MTVATGTLPQGMALAAFTQMRQGEPTRGWDDRELPDRRLSPVGIAPGFQAIATRKPRGTGAEE